MKKLLSLALVLAMGITLVACTKEVKEDVYEIENEEDVVINYEMNEIEMEYYNILKDINENCEVGTAGSSLKAVPFAATIINWSMGSEINDDQIKTVLDYFVSKLEDKDEFLDQMSLVKAAINSLLSDDCDALLEESGNADMQTPWRDVENFDNPRIDIVFNQLGL